MGRRLPRGKLPLLCLVLGMAGCLLAPDRSLLKRDGQQQPDQATGEAGPDIPKPDGPSRDVPVLPDGFQADVVGPNGTMAIYRSVGPGNTQPLAQGATNGTLTVAGTLATLSGDLADNVGVGDVVQYDVDGDGIFSGKDAVAIIHRRYSPRQYAVRTAAAGVPTQILNTATWSIYRAYTSIADAVVGKENIAIQSLLRDFDSWTGGQDLAAAKLAWNIACYADATDKKPVVISGWTTTPDSHLRIFTPTASHLVGGTQRHKGKAGTGFVLETGATAHAVEIGSDNVILEGLEITGWVNGVGSTSFEGVHVAADGVLLTDLIVHDEDYSGVTNPNGDAINLNDMQAGERVTIRNSAIYNISRGAINYQGTLAIEVNIESCTISQTGLSGADADNQGGITIAGTAAKVTAANTISVGSGSGNDFASPSGWEGGSSNNISSDGSAPGSSSLTLKMAADLFVGAGDLHLRSGSPAIGKGKDLSSRFDRDFEGDTRSDPWDVGADER